MEDRGFKVREVTVLKLVYIDENGVEYDLKSFKESERPKVEQHINSYEGKKVDPKMMNLCKPYDSIHG